MRSTTRRDPGFEVRQRGSWLMLMNEGMEDRRDVGADEAR